MKMRRLVPGDAQAYRALMLEAYAREPDAFTSTPEERAALPLSWWERRLDDRPQAQQVVLGIFDDRGRLGGAAGLQFELRRKSRHKASLYGMYVAPMCRRVGAGRRLVEGLLAQARAREGVKLVQLTVTEGNEAAQALYAACGFVAFGVEPWAVAVEQGFRSKVHMWCPVAPLSSPSCPERTP